MSIFEREICNNREERWVLLVNIVQKRNIKIEVMSSERLVDFLRSWQWELIFCIAPGKRLTKVMQHFSWRDLKSGTYSSFPNSFVKNCTGKENIENNEGTLQTSSLKLLIGDRYLSFNFNWAVPLVIVSDFWLPLSEKKCFSFMTQQDGHRIKRSAFYSQVPTALSFFKLLEDGWAIMKMM